MQNKRIYLTFKRIFDIVFAIILLTATLPILILIAILIKLESKGPILFRQDRPGKNAKIFRVMKFRSMRIETEKDGKPLTNINRMTKFGKIIRKLSFDELPQLINILKGEMSFIGPRPLLVEYLPLYNPEQMRRHEATPGISGWAQVNGRNTITWEQKFAYDVYYVENISFMLDLKIFWLTIYKIVNQSGVNKAKDLTMEKFKGSPVNE